MAALLILLALALWAGWAVGRIRRRKKQGGCACCTQDCPARGSGRRPDAAGCSTAEKPRPGRSRPQG